MVRITDVARRAGVSPSTVSYALSGKRPISDETRRRVEAAVRELGYRPQPGAPAHGTPKVLGVAAPLRAGVHVPAMMRLTQSVVTAARGYDHDVLLLTHEEGLTRVRESALVDALLVMDIGLHDPRLPLLRSLNRPSVLLGLPADPHGLTCVDLDYRAAGEACVHHLARLGHRTVALVSSPPEVHLRGTASAHRLVEGFTAAADRHGLASSVHPAGSAPATAHHLADRLLRDHPALTALVVHNAPLLEPLITAFQQLGLRIPEDLSITAVCPDDPATTTSVTLPATELGTRAVELLMEKLHGTPVPETTLLAPRLTERASTRHA
ncbi:MULTISPECIES: LacI family DNA-binding transcriptional regulator [Streptomyces]|uniref:HTH-type transcriptional repressor CytR n=1 Tax=Streptomyces chartreusis NRRL 3882 TaxID=1079985 RepID=A0A2N9BDN0_STRCX|nr:MULTISPECIES: LacI family DNA-binding transcriptional regulator [Streptomyces]MYS88365.1 substrate-binding domain-containing protein [Streptomyces sp. SID5464]SOR81465.1 HTH-type transcriptional repressor CytR [Streptomyces chartreusis NRRL 3882]